MAERHSSTTLTNRIATTNRRKVTILVSLKRSLFSHLKNIKNGYRTTNIDRVIAFWTFLRVILADQTIDAEEPGPTCNTHKFFCSKYKYKYSTCTRVWFWRRSPTILPPLFPQMGTVRSGSTWYSRSSVESQVCCTSTSYLYKYRAFRCTCIFPLGTVRVIIFEI